MSGHLSFPDAPRQRTWPQWLWHSGTAVGHYMFGRCFSRCHKEKRLTDVAQTLITRFDRFEEKPFNFNSKKAIQQSRNLIAEGSEHLASMRRCTSAKARRL